MITYAKIGGLWVLKGSDGDLKKGTMVKVTKKSGETKSEEVGDIIKHEDGVTFAKIADRGPKKEGQLWEECERCGREPVYMPLHLCDRCWPSA